MPWRLLWKLARVKHRFVLLVAGGFNTKELLVYTLLCPRGHSKRAAELRVLIHGIRDHCKSDGRDWRTWEEAIR